MLKEIPGIAPEDALHLILGKAGPAQSVGQQRHVRDVYKRQETIRVQAEADAATGLFALVNNITEAVRAEFRPAGAAARPASALADALAEEDDLYRDLNNS